MLRNNGLSTIAILGIGFLTASAAETRAQTPIIFDTDISGDVDDVLALAMLHTLADRDECEIRAVTISKINPLTGRMVDAVNSFYSRPNIPVGVTHDAQRRDSKYLRLVETRDHGRCVRVDSGQRSLPGSQRPQRN